MVGRRRAVVALALLSGAGPLSACSVGMAASGREEPDLAVCSIGAARTDIERELGPPTSIEALPDGRTTCIYEYQLGNEPSTGRAVAHGALDVLTLGIWEAVGTPIEALHGETYRLSVTYGPDGRAAEIRSGRIGN